MDELSPELAARSRSIRAAILSALHKARQGVTAQHMGLSGSGLSRWINETPDLDRACDLMAALDLRVVQSEATTFDPEYVAALETLARQRLERREDTR